MAAVTLPNSGIKAGFLVNENGWADEMNQALRVMDALIQARALDRTDAPPGGPTNNGLYMIGAAPSGAWSGQAQKLAIWQQGDDLTSAWLFITPREGWRVWVADEDAFYQYDGSVWVLDASSEVLPSRYSADFGDGSAASFNIVHNLNTRDVRVEVYRNATPWDTIVCDVARLNANTVTLSGFGGAPSVNEFRVTISK